jgi:1-deoxy-D-xylulose-5-phosphate reductoisomerase
VKRVVVLGSTGSIGRQTLEVIAAHPDRFSVTGIAAAHTGPEFLAQTAAWPTARVWTAAGRPPADLVKRWAGGGLEELAASGDADLVVVATSGMAALRAVLAALASGRRVALANKETLVAGGHLVADLLDRLGGDPLDRLRPIDSEHSAIWQCLVGEPRDGVARLILTASGGPFRGRSADDLEGVTVAEALAHPTWQMGPKVTIDSATMVNKAFEAIEARWLYRIPYDRIQAVIHPRSIVHSLVEFVDGSYKAQLGLPDMRLPIQYALTHPERLPSPARHVSPTEWGDLQFLPMPAGKYPAYEVVRAAAEAGGNRGAILHAADEVAVEAFTAGALSFPRIAATIESAVAAWGNDDLPGLEEVEALDAAVRGSLSSQLGLGGAN